MGPTSTVSAQQNTDEGADSGTEEAPATTSSAESADASTGSGAGDPVEAIHELTATTPSTERDGDSSLSEARTQIDRENSGADVSAQTVSVRSATATTTPAAATTTVTVATPTTASATVTAAEPMARTIAVRPQAAAPVTVASIVTDVLTWIGLGPLANGLPVPAAPVPSLVESLWLAVRQTQYVLNNQRPVAQPTVSGQGPDGVITGRLNVSDYDDSALAYVVSRAPERGTLVVDEFGIFTYTPDSALAAAGDTDTFTISIDDTVGNPAHVHGILGLIGRAGPTSATVTVTVAPAAETVGTTSHIGVDPVDLADLVARPDVAVSLNPDGAVGFLDGTFTDKTVATKADAAAVLNGLASLLGAPAGFASPDNITVQRIGGSSAIPGDVAETIYRVRDSVAGIPVLGSEVILVTDSEGTVTGLFNNHDGRIASTDLTPDARIDDEAEAVAVAATAYLSATTGQSDRTALAAFIALSTFDPDLVVFALDSGAPPRLAWRVVVDPGDVSQSLGLTDPEPGHTYFIYANGADAGTVIVDTPNAQALATTATANDVLGQARQINIVDTTIWFVFHYYELADVPRNLATYWTSYQFFGWGAPVLPGSLVSQGWFGWDAAPVSAHANMAEVYDYYTNVLGLTSFNGNGARINVSVGYNPHTTWSDYFTGYSNAFWSPSLQQFVFGNGGNLQAALDVVAHEYTHAVISYAVGDGGSVLDYGESGAVNEAFADILGSLIEDKSGAGRWLMGEDSDFVGGAVRNLADPSTITTGLGPYRETYASRYTGTGDDGGEHLNSTIFSHAAYKMMTDPVTGDISDETWARVFYHALYRLSPGATFIDGRAAVVDSADAMGFSAVQLQAIARAFDDVGIVAGVTVLV